MNAQLEWVNLDNQNAGKKRQPACPFINPFKKLWADAFREQFKFEYVFVHGKEGALLKAFFKSGITPEEAMAIVKAAWDKQGKEFFYCTRANSIPFFVSKFNEIRTELARAGFQSYKDIQYKDGF